MRFIQYIATAFGSAFVVSFVSLIWPRVTTQPRPQPLTQVREMVLQTEQGKRLAEVFGVSDESKVRTQSLGEFVSQQTNTVITNVADSSQRAVINQMLTQLADKFNQLPDDQKKQFQSLVCQPVSSASSDVAR